MPMPDDAGGDSSVAQIVLGDTTGSIVERRLSAHQKL
jgi:hypothetical protein